MKYLIIYVLLLFPSIASAQNDIYGVNDLQNANLGTRDLRDTISGIINIVLGFLGILATVMILYGGLKWMTSAGNTSQVEDGKKAIGAGVIGLLIVLASYAIARYVLSRFQEELNP